MTSIDLVDQCLKICTWIPLTMVKFLLLNSASAYASSVINKFLNSFTACGFRLQILRIPPTFADSTYILRNPLTVAESRTTSYICLLRNAQQIKCADKCICKFSNKQISEFLYSLRIPLTNFADSTFICGFYLHFAESTYSCGIQNN